MGYSLVNGYIRLQAVTLLYYSEKSRKKARNSEKKNGMGFAQVIRGLGNQVIGELLRRSHLSPSPYPSRQGRGLKRKLLSLDG
jgi:hypothetical protein